MADLVAGRVDSYRMVKQYIHADGHRVWGDLSVGCVRNTDGSIEVAIGQIVDITAQVETKQLLERLARFDSLTGLANRSEVIARLEAALESSRSSDAHLGVLFCDIDSFKEINDTFGHVVGDVMLSSLATRIGQCVRDGDVVGRTGGDEILILMPGLASIDEAAQIAEEIRHYAAEPIESSGQTISLTVSIGAVLAASGETVLSVMARADAAMYQAKERRNAVVSIA